MPKIGIGQKDEKAFAEFLKKTIPNSARNFNPKTRVWYISEEYFLVALAWKRYKGGSK